MRAPAFLSAQPGALLGRQGRGQLACAVARTPLRTRRSSEARMPLRPSTPVCFSEPPGDADDDEEDEETLLLTDHATGRSLACGVEHHMQVRDRSYLICYPVDEPVAFAKFEGRSGRLQAVEDPVDVDRLFRNAEAVLAEEDIKLLRSAYVLTVDDQSALDEEEEEDDDDEQFGEEDERQWEGSDEQEVEVIAEFLHEGVEYLVVKPMEPVLLVAREEDDEYVVLEGEELDEVSPFVEKFIEELDEQPQHHSQ